MPLQRAIISSEIAALATALTSGRCPSGLVLDLSNNHLDAASIAVLATALESGRCPSGLVLNLGTNALDAAGIAALAAALASGQCPNGLTLNLRYSSLNAECIEHLAAALASGQCPNGLTLNLGFNSLNAECIEHLAAALESGKCPRGLTLGLDGRIFSAADADVLVKALLSQYQGQGTCATIRGAGSSNDIVWKCMQLIFPAAGAAGAADEDIDVRALLSVMVIHFKRLPEYYSQAIASKFFDLLKAQVVGLLTVKGDDAFFEQGRPRPFEIANALEKTLSLLPPKPVHVEGKALLAEIFMHVAESYLPTTPEALAKRHVLFNEALLHNPQDEHLKQHSVGAHITLLLRLAGKVCSLDEVMALRGQDLRQHPQAQVAKQHILSAMRELFGFTDTFSSRNFLVKEEKGDWVTPPRQGQQHRYRLFSGSTKDFPVFDDASVRKVTPPEGAGRPTAPTPRRGSVGG